jgi:hypothetical protein
MGSVKNGADPYLTQGSRAKGRKKPLKTTAATHQHLNVPKKYQLISLLVLIQIHVHLNFLPVFSINHPPLKIAEHHLI